MFPVSVQQPLFCSGRFFAEQPTYVAGNSTKGGRLLFYFQAGWVIAGAVDAGGADSVIGIPFLFGYDFAAGFRAALQEVVYGHWPDSRLRGFLSDRFL